jgi:hypothetical protein
MKGSRKKVDELRAEYKRSDFGPLVRGKYTKRLSEATNVVLLDDLLRSSAWRRRARSRARRPAF